MSITFNEDVPERFSVQNSYRSTTVDDLRFTAGFAEVPGWSSLKLKNSSSISSKHPSLNIPV